MKLPWDKNYLKISFHIIFTLVVIYALFRCVDMLAYAVTNLDDICKRISKFTGELLRIFSPVVTGFIIAYLLDPMAEFFQNKYDAFLEGHLRFKGRGEFFGKLGARVRGNIGGEKTSKFKKRTAGAVLSYLLIIAVIAFAAAAAAKKIKEYGGGNILQSLALLIDDSVSEFLITYRDMESNFEELGVYGYSSEYMVTLADSFAGFIKNIGMRLGSFTKSLGEAVPIFLISLVIAFYFIKDKEHIKHKFAEVFSAVLPERAYRLIHDGLEDINAVFSGYIRGQLADALIMAGLISAALYLIGLPFPFIIGMISGLFNIIPYFGALIGLLLAASVALITVSPAKALYAAAVVFILHQIDGMVIAPKVVGESVRLSPVLVIIALVVCGRLFGIAGMLLAVPVFAVLKLFVSRFFMRLNQGGAD